MYEIDRYTIEQLGMDGKILMENAGREITKEIIPLVSDRDRILILVGSGNNGGDGFVVARTLRNLGYHPFVLQLVTNEKIKGDAAYHKQLFCNFGGSVEILQNVDEIHRYITNADVIVDAILGIGVTGNLRSPIDQVVQAINDSEKRTISVDIPSGVPADEGVEVFDGVKADYTIVVDRPKISAFLTHCAKYYGEWKVVDIGLPPSISSTVKTWMKADVQATLPKRNKYAHKGNHGKGLIVGGSIEMPGSIAMTASAALRSGSGLLTVASVKGNIPSIAMRCAEATYRPLKSQQGAVVNQEVDLFGFDAIAIGMGMGRDPNTAIFTKKVVAEAEMPVLIDADGLHHIKEDLSILTDRSYPTVLTPHLGEMAMLTERSVKEIMNRPFAIAKQFACQHQIYLVLKGAFTIVTDPSGQQWVNTTGNAGLAKGGSGDVLSGILLAMMMQGTKVQVALSNGCYLHGASADHLVENHHSQRDLLATDVVQGLTSVFRTFS